MRSATGAECFFGVSLSPRTYDVTDSTGRLLAMAWPEADPGSQEMLSQCSCGVSSHAWQIRLAPHADVSLVLVGLATIANLA
eukprot:CAMPEP_0172793290 /NCGR_PEP_ID=MMETSP1074-20121228/209403_1 /TAXON_ID=2916 /ORGANISM="Ceratium fusus, Strain PA161109" /LENGTH=81 /DNA_ID=CAMNT_0013630365 /DNA_START=543 /DNA_END=788 /DNA_ORIENTATION=-